MESWKVEGLMGRAASGEGAKAVKVPRHPGNLKYRVNFMESLHV